MKITTDVLANVGYLYMDNRQPIMKTITSEDNLFNFDVDYSGNLVGVEILSLTKFTKNYNTELIPETVFNIVTTQFKKVEK